MTGMAEAAAWRGDWRGAIDWGEQGGRGLPRRTPRPSSSSATPTRPSGETTEAERHRTTASRTSPTRSPGSTTATGPCSCADKGRDLDEALALARKDLELRHDVHAYDTLAWVCFKKGDARRGRRGDASRPSRRGTREATLLYHAGMIARAAGDPAGQGRFHRARAINPRSVPARWLRWLDATPDGATR